MSRAARTLMPCGTAAAWQRHYKRGEPIDQACRDAHNAAERAYYRTHHPARHNEPAPQPPLDVTPRAVLAAIDGCHLDIAETAALLHITVDRCRSLLAAARHPRATEPRTR